MTSQDPGAKAPGQFRMILKYKATSYKLQAPSFPAGQFLVEKKRKKDLTSFKLSGINRIIKENKK